MSWKNVAGPEVGRETRLVPFKVCGAWLTGDQTFNGTNRVSLPVSGPATFFQLVIPLPR